MVTGRSGAGCRRGAVWVNQSGDVATSRSGAGCRRGAVWVSQSGDVATGYSGAAVWKVVAREIPQQHGNHYRHLWVQGCGSVT